MEDLNILKLWHDCKNIQLLINLTKNHSDFKKILLKNINGSLKSIVFSSIVNNNPSKNNVFIAHDLEEALYFLDDLQNIDANNEVCLLPSSDRIHLGDNNVILERIEVLKRIQLQKKISIITYPSAIKEKIISESNFELSQLLLKVNNTIDLDKLEEELDALGFTNENFVLKPGDYAIRGMIVDIFSYSNENPCRLILEGNTIEEISFFTVSNQISTHNVEQVSIIANIETAFPKEKKESLFSYLPNSTNIWIDNANSLFVDDNSRNNNLLSNDEFKRILKSHKCIYTNDIIMTDNTHSILFDSSPRLSFNKNFEILIDHLDEYKKRGYNNMITVSSENQYNRLLYIFKNYQHLVTIKLTACLNSGFIDHENKIILYTDHEIFEKHHQYKSKRMYKTDNAISIKEITDLKKGDYVTHFDYGVGIFDGLRNKSKLGKSQESIKIIYKNDDVLYVSIHSLHKIAKYKNLGEEATLDKIGSPRWKKLKEKVKSKIKVVAFDLIKLYAKRKITKGFSFSKDTYLQNELEASFIFQDTEDQIQITKQVKEDMESPFPMDRLICGDVGFGKTEIAIRAAFKAIADNKQVAILVPTTILALQHYKTFTKRLENFPCTINYLNRFKSKKETNEVLKKLKDGLIDIIIGTHRIVSDDIHFKELGLLIIDEEQKFGVSVKDKLKTIKENVDTLTLTATPIPRTLQFSLMGSRDLSIMTTFPKNRNPIETRIAAFNYEDIKDIISHEVSRGGQVFFVHNRIVNIEDVHATISHMCPKLNIKFAHGQMEAKKLENTIIDFINGEFDVLITTTIIENGLDIPNANTIIINNAQNFGLADLHQMRGRVGRSNKKAFCYLMTPPFNKMKDLAIKRLNAMTNLSGLGDGFNIAMKDLEIRGAGNMLGAEQSGFIEEVGFTNYQKILDEAVREIKNNQFKDSPSKIFQDNHNVLCSIETDLELLIPSDYVTDVSERMNLYNRLSKYKEEKELESFKIELKDRFGEVPRPTHDLLQSVYLRTMGEEINCEKIIIKNMTMILVFNENNSLNSMSENVWKNIMRMIQDDRKNRLSIKEEKNKMKLYIKYINNVDDSIKILEKLNSN